MSVAVVVPVKSFSLAKARLADVFSTEARASVGRALADRVVTVVAEAGAEPLVVGGDEGVLGWARDRGIRATVAPPGLNAAAAMVTTLTAGRPWAVLHADLPLLSAADVVPAFDVVAGGGYVLAPSSDGGTALLGGHGTVTFSYGPASFHRHLAALADRDPLVLVRTGLLLDLDSPADLTAALRHPRGRWLAEFLP